MRLCRHCLSVIGEGELSEECEACCNLFDRINEFAEKIVQKLSEYEFRTLNIGSREWGSAKALHELMERKGIEYDLKKEFNERLGRKISELSGKVRSLNPEINVIFDLETFDFKLHIGSAYIYGRYIKRVRNISQTRWMCGFCKGDGCEICNFTGKKYGTSVEELISTPAIRIVEAKDAKLHGAGREDVDARMLGRGRPFVLELIEPRKRFVELGEVERAINEYAGGKVKVFGLEYADSKRVREVKMERHRKKYRAKIVFEDNIDTENLLNAIEELKGAKIRQRTPKRVAHRRADKVRVRRVYDIKILFHREKVAVMEIEADAGLYIKELVSGDEGRTRPSLSSITGINCKVEKLDVIDVFDSYSTSISE